MSVVRRLRNNLGWLGLLALLSVAAALLVTASPRIANGYTDEGLREQVTSLPYLARDVSYIVDSPIISDPASGTSLRPGTADLRKGLLLGTMPVDLRERLSGSWYATQLTGDATGPDLEQITREQNIASFVFSLRDQSGAGEAVRMTDGAFPVNPPVVGERIRSAVSTAVADTFGLRVGSTLRLASPEGSVNVEIVGIFEPVDRGAPVWVEQPEVFEPVTPIGDDPPQPWRATILTDTLGMNTAAQLLGGDIHFTWRFRLDESQLTMANLAQVTDAALNARRQTAVPGAATVTSLDSSLARFAALAASTRALLAIVQAGIGVTLFGLIVLAALAAGQRRHGEFALLRSRGGSLLRLGGRVLLEAAPVVAVAMVAGCLLGARAPGRSDSTVWLAVPFGIAAALVAPALAMVFHRQVSVAGSRTDLARPVASPRRVTAEITLVVLAVAGVLLLRRRGLGSEVDLYLVVLPALIAAAAANVALRVLPYPLRLASGLAARARGAVAFLGLTRAGRAAPASAGPVAVLVVAVSVATFCAAVAGSISVARDRVTDATVPGAAFVQGGQFPAGTVDLLGAVPGVEAVAALTLLDNTPLAVGSLREGRSVPGVTVIIVDPDALAGVLAASGSTQVVPETLRSAGPAATAESPVPALVSSRVAANLSQESGSGSASGEGYLIVQGHAVPLHVAAVADTFPGLGTDNTRFVVLPRPALAAATAGRLVPTAFALAGDDLDAPALQAVGDDAQRAWISDVRGHAYTGDLTHPTSVLTWAQARADLERGGVDRVLDYTFGIGLSAGLVLALLAVAFAVATGARGRGQALSRLRTMGLAPGQGRRLLAYELLPMVLLGALVGAAVGTTLPVLLGPALGLTAFSDGGAVTFSLDPMVPGLAFALVFVAVVLAMLVEAALNRRARLGAVLRVGGES